MKLNAARFWSGLTAIPAGWRLLRREKGLWIWILIPWLIDLTVLMIGWGFGVQAVQALTAWAVSKLSVTGWLFDVLYYPAVIVLGFMFIVVWLVAVLAVATVIASPFNALLAERALVRQGVKTAGAASVGAWVRLFLHMTWIAVIKACIFGALGLALLVLSFVPGLNLLAAYASMCVFAADVFDYSFEATGLSFRRRLAEWRAFNQELGGLGGSLLLTSLLPGLTVLLLPVAVLGGTTLVVARSRPNPEMAR
jgi:uncharacterized protein involved in cysteine biosynthesis